MFKKNYKIKRTISMKQFISQYGENFSEHMKQRLMELEVRCVLTRKDDEDVLDLKHVEHTKFNSNADENVPSSKKEYVYGQFVVEENNLFFSKNCVESKDVMEAPIVSTIFNSLSENGMITLNEQIVKKVNDSNIDYIIDTLLTVYPEVSQKYKDIIKHMNSFAVK